MNKSEQIRQAIAKKPTAKPKEIVQALAARNVKVSPALVASVLYRMNRETPGSGLNVEALVEAKKLADKIGLNEAQQALSVLARLR